MSRKARINEKAKEKNILAKQVKIKHRTLQERIAGFNEGFVCLEWNTGKPEGKEKG
jgi:hypothetical protein